MRKLLLAFVSLCGLFHGSLCHIKGETWWTFVSAKLANCVLLKFFCPERSSAASSDLPPISWLLPVSSISSAAAQQFWAVFFLCFSRAFAIQLASPSRLANKIAKKKSARRKKKNTLVCEDLKSLLLATVRRGFKIESCFYFKWKRRALAVE